MKQIHLTILACCAFVFTNAQQLQTSSLYENQALLHNPANAGLKGNVIGISYRSTFTGVGGNPKTAIAFGSFQLPKNDIGIGGYVYNDVTGPTSRTGVLASFAKYIKLNNNAKLSIGIEGRFQQFAIDRNKLLGSLGQDPVLASIGNEYKFDAGVGIAYYSEKWQIGASVSQLVQPKLNFYSGNLSRSEQARLYRHYYLHGAYTWDVDGTTKIIPHALFVYLPNAPLEFQGGVRAEHNDVFWWGLGVRLKQSLVFSAGVKINKKFTIGYAYDLYRTPWSIFDSKGASGNELLLHYSFGK